MYSQISLTVSKVMIILMDERVIGMASFTVRNPPQNYQAVNRYMVISVKEAKMLPNTLLSTSLLTDYSYDIAVSVLAPCLILSLTFACYSRTMKRK